AGVVRVPGGARDRGSPADHAHLPRIGERGRGPGADRVPEGALGREGPGVLHERAPVRRERSRQRAGAMSTPRKGTNYLNVSYGIRSWLFSVDHKRIALLYLCSVTLMFVLGGLFAAMVRMELLTPAGDMLASDTYNKVFTMHGIVMVFFFLIPGIPAVLGNFLVPMMVGARDLAFPRLNLLSWYLYTVGALFTLFNIVIGGVDTGWTFYTPYSSAWTTTNIVPVALGIFVTGFSSILTGLNFIVTIHTMR